jgi:hypothetical protein
MRSFHRLAPSVVLALALAIFAALAGACGDNTRPQAPDDAGIDAQPQPLAPCLDRPTDLPRPPPATGQLPCELLPPGFVAR